MFINKLPSLSFFEWMNEKKALIDFGDWTLLNTRNLYITPITLSYCITIFYLRLENFPKIHINSPFNLIFRVLLPWVNGILLILIIQNLAHYCPIVESLFYSYIRQIILNIHVDVQIRLLGRSFEKRLDCTLELIARHLIKSLASERTMQQMIATCPYVIQRYIL